LQPDRLQVGNVRAGISMMLKHEMAKLKSKNINLGFGISPPRKPTIQTDSIHSFPACHAKSASRLILLPSVKSVPPAALAPVAAGL
jgi:hypothetical protein